MVFFENEENYAGKFTCTPRALQRNRNVTQYSDITGEAPLFSQIHLSAITVYVNTIYMTAVINNYTPVWDIQSVEMFITVHGITYILIYRYTAQVRCGNR